MFSAALIFAAFANSAGAANHVVTAQLDMTFDPETITIYQHDTIEFKNAGGTHNVHADNDSFICADDCNLHPAPSSDLWDSTVTFKVLGTVGYFCEAHGNLSGGMRGTIIVIDRVFVDGFESP